MPSSEKGIVVKSETRETKGSHDLILTRAQWVNFAEEATAWEM